MTPPSSASGHAATSDTHVAVKSVPALHSLQELLQQEGEKFIASAYATLLRRPADPVGYSHYLGQLRQTGDKIGILYEICQGEEARRVACNLPGLQAAMRRRRLRNLPLLRQFAGLMRQGSYSEATLMALRDIGARLGDLDERLTEQARLTAQLRTELITAPPPHATAPASTPAPASAANDATASYTFDPAWYLSMYADVGAQGIDPLEHYVRFGKPMGRFACRAQVIDQLMDGQRYLQMYPDVAALGLDPLEHYITRGRHEARVGGKLPLKLFDEDWYLRRNPDVALAKVDPLLHFTRDGLAQERPWTSFKPLRDVTPDPLVYSEPPANPKARLIAFYLPQFHPIPENDAWWGKGFTEWANVTRAKPYYDDHDQPRLPGELGFYDLRMPEVMRRQAELAAAHGVFGFCFHIYWFGGKRLLQGPIEMLLKHPEIDIRFCYCWANENWTRRWDGLDSEVLIAQSHSPQDDLAFIENIAPAFRDRRYIRVSDRPMLVVYRPSLFPDIAATVERWRDWCRTHGYGEIHVCCTESFDRGDPTAWGMDASIQFPPVAMPVEEITEHVKVLDSQFVGQAHNYMASAKAAQKHVRPAWPQYRGVMPSWDNTARKMERGISFYGATPELYAEWLDSAMNDTVQHLPEDRRFVFINAWNEWAEGAYLEPDRRRGYAYLNRTREVVARYADRVIHDAELRARRKRRHDVAVVVHLHYGDLLPVIASYAKNVPQGADLYFSVREGCYPEMLAAVRGAFPDAVVVSYPNHGRDVVPFLKILEQIQGMGYRAVCKIHSKKSTHRADGDRWRDEVYGKLLGSAETVTACLQQLQAGAGILAPAGHLLGGHNYWGSNAARTTELALRMGCPPDWMHDFVFPAGTMFWFQPQALAPLLALGLHDEDFEVEAGQVDGTTAHAVERLIGLSARKLGMPVVETSTAPVAQEFPYAARSA